MPLVSPYAYDRTGALLRNRFNWLGLLRACRVVTNPARFFAALLRRRAPATLSVRTPTGTITLALRNFESLKTFFGVFCREDYATPSDRAFFFFDIGANIGFASAYFLSRNRDNRVCCFEPDETNLAWLARNLAGFSGRATIVNRAVAPAGGETTLYRAETGKHSALHPSELAMFPQKVASSGFGEVLADGAAGALPTVVKLDVEGLEEELIRSVKFENYPQLRRLLCESTTCSPLISRPHRRALRNGYIEDLSFVG
ncbi:MAG TPA: FkbM family methyltransferase [Stellaceae bacterium]|jgi:FkbM family methyltransferase